jgi:hypothetical protein
VLLDYGSGSERNARDIAALIRLQYGSTRLVLLSSRSSLPPEMAGLVDEFAHRDGDESVLSALKQWLIRGRSAGQGAE